MASHNASIAAIKRHRTAKIASLGTKAYYLYRRGQQEKMYTLICEEFIELGGIYIKFLQGVLLQNHALRNWHNPDKLKVFENLDHEPLDVVRLLQTELPPEKLALITSIQPQPFAAGSFGQVYYGQHANGKPIIIKVLRPMVRELLRYDLRLIGMFSRSLANRVTDNIDFNLNTAIKDFRVATLRETDYIGEAHFAQELFEAYRDNPMFIIPETFLDLCTPNIIVQEYVDGLSVAQLIRLQEQGADPRQYTAEVIGSDLDKQLELLGVELFASMFSLSRVQGDPHPGNIRLMTGNRIGMIDFGIAAPTPDNKAAFYGIVDGMHQIYSNNFDISRLFEQFIRFFVNDLYRALRRLASHNQSLSKNTSNETENYTQEIGKLAQAAFKTAVGVENIRALIEDGRILQIMNQVINKDNRFGLVIKLEASEILRATQTYMSLVDTLGRRTAVMPKVLRNVVERVQREHPEVLSKNDGEISVSQALDIVSNWLERVANRDPLLFSQLMKRIKMGTSTLKPRMPVRHKVSRRVERVEPEKEQINA
ncbi:MAG TPA: AarF/ABC1/UbiB kinase family protein [Candidatus Saccharimonadales bacterium]|jgi:predicted unusual protein kinase regulating ubiquinone biosynthesis (AarF/ABC1/UbiB family)|nr:AarF/ABC1/UbiB kinase family protein [Candidatus Saccharimonadales bacterium]